EAAGNRDALLDGPLPQLERVEIDPLVHLVGRQGALGDPAADRLLVHAEIGGSLAHGELHGGRRPGYRVTRSAGRSRSAPRPSCAGTRCPRAPGPPWRRGAAGTSPSSRPARP